MTMATKTRTGLLLVAIATAMPGTALPAEITLADAVRTALEKNPQLVAARELIIQAKANRDRAFALISPQVSASYLHRINDREIAFDAAEGFDTSALTDAFTSIYGNVGYIYGELFENGMIDADECGEIAVINGYEDCAALTEAFLNGDDLTPGDDDDAEAEPIVIQPKQQDFLALDIQWPISPRAIAVGQAGNHAVKAAEAQVEQARDQVLLGIVQAYSAAWQTQEAGKVLREQVSLAEKHLAETQALDAAGLVTADVILRARLEVEKVRRALAEAEQAARATRRGLAVAAALSEVPDTLAPLPDIQVTPQESAQWATEAKENRPEGVVATEQLAAAKAMQDDAILQFVPTFAITGQFAWQSPVGGFSSKATSWNIGLAVQVPIWDGGLKIQAVREAASRKRQAMAQGEAVQRQVDAEARNAWDAYAVANAAVEVARLEAELAREAHRIVELRYEAGQARQVEVLDARSAMAMAELGHVQARAKRETAAADLLAKVGRVAEAM
jgi:outer membrane protein TolC